MKMVLQNVLLCCLLASLLPSTLSATLPSDGGDKLSMWLSSRLRRELCVPDSLEDSAELLPQQQQDRDTHSLTHKHSGQSGRVKRGCNLLTCSMHDVAHRISQLRERTNSAPPEKIGSNGYGRRRRRSLPQRSAELARRQGRAKPAWLQPQRRAPPQKRT
ncbi:pro-adrenomedullin [Salminus brasiliensis]|uniref:pro-adrenomedullin n=1 Tax=Salminus brasiliensis TaxID=930266 RepID=UPI003B837BDC